MHKLVFVLLLLSAAVGVLARPMGIDASNDERMSAFYTHELDVARTLATLSLTPAQKQTLLPIISASANEIIAIHDAKVKAQPELEQAMTKLRAAVLANKDVPEEVKRAVRNAEGSYKKLSDKHDKSLYENAQKVWAILTTAQGAQLRRLPHAPVGYESDDAWVKLEAKKLHPAPRDLDKTLTSIYNSYGLTAGEIIRASTVGKPVLQEWSALAPKVAKGQQEAYLRRMIALPEQGILTPKPEPEVEKTIGANLLSQETMHLLDATVPEPPSDDMETPQYKATVTDIHVLNLVNVLNLTLDQMKALVPIETKAKDEYAKIELQRSDIAKRSLPVLQQLRDGFSKGTPPDTNLTSLLGSLENERKQLHKQEAALDQSYMTDIAKLLTEAQVAVVSRFNPGTIPANPAKPESKYSKMETALTNIRTVPEAQLPDAIAKLKTQVEDTFKRNKHFRPEEIAAVQGKVPDVVSRARAFDDTEFKLRKTDLAKELSVPEKAPAEGKKLNDRYVTYLCSPNLIPILTDRSAGK